MVAGVSVLLDQVPVTAVGFITRAVFLARLILFTARQQSRHFPLLCTLINVTTKRLTNLLNLTITLGI